jgi:hypothetical protein
VIEARVLTPPRSRIFAPQSWRRSD